MAEEKERQAGAELCQAQFKLGLAKLTTFSLKLFYLIFLLELEIWLYNKKAP